MTTKEAAELLDLIADRAPKLREAGIRGEVELAGMARFSVGEDDARRATTTPAAEPIGDPLDDPETFGLPPGSKIPGRQGASK
jgi:hypothetical protein